MAIWRGIGDERFNISCKKCTKKNIKGCTFADKQSKQYKLNTFTPLTGYSVGFGINGCPKEFYLDFRHIYNWFAAMERSAVNIMDLPFIQSLIFEWMQVDRDVVTREKLSKI